jgi:hypothetical protein
MPWRLGKASEAERHFERTLWLDPSDNQGIRFVLDDVKKGRSWTET